MNEQTALDILEDGKLGEWFRGELGAPDCDNQGEWIKTAEALSELLNEGITRVRRGMISEGLAQKALLVKARKFYADEKKLHGKDFSREDCLEDIHRAWGKSVYDYMNRQYK